MSNGEGVSSLWKNEDWWAVWVGFAIVIVAVASALMNLGIKAPKLHRWVLHPLDAFYPDAQAEVEDWPADANIPPALKGKFGYTRKAKYHDGQRKTSEMITWKTRYPMDANSHRQVLAGLCVSRDNKDATKRLYERSRAGSPNYQALVILLLALGVPFALAIRGMGEEAGRFLFGFAVVFALAVLAYFISAHATIKAYGLPYALWALVLGLLISNTIGTPKWLLGGAKTELFIKTGLVLLGAEIIFGKIVVLGSRGLLVAWLVTPCVVIFMYFFGTRILKMTSKTLVIIIAAATSVCGVSAAIATAAAAKAKKEELTLAVGMTLIFTVLMMIAMPPIIKAIGMDEQVGGAWMGGTIDATGAVVAAGALLGDNAEVIAAVVKMIQNVLIGVVAFCVAVAWVTRVDKDPDAPRPSAMEIWYRFPKFIVGFVLASVVFSFVLIPAFGEGEVGLKAVENDVLGAITKTCRGWLFCIAFVAIGLESNFRQLASQLAGGKPIVLYVVGQSFNLILTVAAAYLAFGGILFEQVF